jgi:hypothetical protein
MLRKKKDESWLPARMEPLKPLEYNGKILLAWGEAIDGNVGIRDWLMRHGYPELGVFVFALRLKPDARQWLMENGYAHLMAMIHGAEGNASAVNWLERSGFPILSKMALAVDGHREALEWLMSNGHADFAVLAVKMRRVKDEIEQDNNDIHRISKE